MYIIVNKFIIFFEGILPHKSISSCSVIFFIPLNVSFVYRNGFENIELGFLIGKAYQGQGYAYEACDAILKYGKEVLGLETVQTLVKKENEVSIRLCEKLGFIRNKTVSIEENIYGQKYPGSDDAEAESDDPRQVRVNKSHYGEYIRFDKKL